MHKLTITALHRPIKEAMTIGFAVPEQLVEKFQYQPGQYLTLQFIIDGKEVRRSYSLNSCPFKKESLSVTVKRVKDGLVSNYVNDQLKVGDTVSVMEPQGLFYANIQSDAYKTYYLFAAGSGITPIISILKSVLAASPHSIVHLLYGNSNQDTIIFKEELNELRAQQPDRLTIEYTLSDPKVWSVWKQWKGRKGRIDAATVEWFIAEHPPIAQTTEYFICGPGAMNTGVRDTLLSLGVPKELINIEQFGVAKTATKNDVSQAKEAQLTAQLNGRSHQLTIPKGKSILEVLQDAKLDPPYSCESGVCASCVCKLVKGKVEMEFCMALDDAEIAEGMVLACQAKPVTEEVAVVFE